MTAALGSNRDAKDARRRWDVWRRGVGLVGGAGHTADGGADGRRRR